MVKRAATMRGVPRSVPLPAAAGDPRRGAALFVVLVFSVLLAALAGAATRTALSGARAAAVFADGLRAEVLGRGAADALAYRLAAGDADAKRGGAIGLRLPGVEVTIDYVSESARVDVNAAPLPLLAAVLAASGAEPAEVGAAVASAARFRAVAAARAQAARAAQAGAVADDPAGSAPATGGLAAIRAAVDALGPAAKPKPAPSRSAAIRDLSEVAAAWGLSEALARRVLPSLTVSSGLPTVDPVLAGRPVLLALLGSDERVDDYIQRRLAGFADKDSALALLPVPSRDFAAFEDAPAVRAVAKVRVANRFERRYEIVMAPPPSGGSPAPDVTALPARGAIRSGPPDGASKADARDATPVVVSWRVLP